MAVPQPGVWGIDLGQCAVKAIRLENQDGKIVATAFDYIEHPKILSQPDADPEQLTREALEKLLERNKLKGDQVAISVPGQSGLARFVKLPPVEEKKINDIVRFEAKQQIPFPLDEVVWDFQKLGGGSVADGYAMETEIGLFAMKRETVHRYLDHFKEAHVDIHVVQMAPLALVNYVAHDLLNKTAGDQEEDEEEKGKGCIVALDIGADNSNLVITEGERIIWQRPIPIGGNHFTRALTKDLKLTFAKAEHLKRNAVKSPDLKKILISLRPVLNDFVAEVQRSLGYFTNTHRDANIQYMIGLGNAFRLPGLQKFLQEKLQLEVRKLTKFQRLSGSQVTAAPQFTENVMSFAVAYGLALQGLKQTRLQTNLLPKEIQTERVIRAKKPWAVAAAAALLLAVGLLGVTRFIEHSAYANPRVKNGLKAGDVEMDGATGSGTRLKKAEDDAKASKDAAERIAAGVPMRFNWNQLYQYLNDSLPRPDGSKVPVETRSGYQAKKNYWDKGGKAAHDKSLALRAEAATGIPSPDSAKIEEEVKKGLVAITIESVTPLWVDSVSDLFANLNFLSTVEKRLFPGMANDDRKLVDDKDKWPKDRGWVIEVRGFTYHQDGEQFVLKTLLENLQHPQGVGNKLPDSLKRVEEKDGKKTEESLVKYSFLFAKEVDKNPQPGQFISIKTSLLSKALTPRPAGGEPAPEGKKDQPPGQPVAEPDKKAPGREQWRPLGTIAAASLGAGGVQGVNEVRPVPQPPVTKDGAQPPEPLIPRQPRVEFHLLFFWAEPLPAEAGQSETQG